VGVANFSNLIERFLAARAALAGVTNEVAPMLTNSVQLDNLYSMFTPAGSGAASKGERSSLLQRNLRSESRISSRNCASRPG
jgi:hypothetical protein